MKNYNVLVTLLFSISLLACSGSSDVGQQQDAEPVAKAAVFGSSQTTSEYVSVRAGSEVLLSGQNSEGVDDPILKFDWRQIDDSGYVVALKERTTNAVVFTAPQVPITETEGVELEFELVIEDADAREAKDSVTVRVMPSGDTDHFLSRPQNEEQYVLLVGPDTGTTLSNDVPITVTIEESTSWLDRTGQARQQQTVSKQLTATVKAGTFTNITDKNNVYFLEALPKLDADSINTFFQGEQRAGRLEFEAVEDARHTITISLEQQAAGDIVLSLARIGDLGFELLDNTAAQTGLNRYQFELDWLQQQVGVASRTSANNYYRCIDPLDEATTLESWLDKAGFNKADDIVHTSYLNNFDLNFGRDMFVRQDDNGNVYSYVTNYPNLENTLTKRNEFAVVVMEYSPAPTGKCGDATFTDDLTGKKIVKFYAYVPDQTTGKFVRAPTMNFDGRGERALPGVCIACHFGDANESEFNVADITGIDASAADLDSSFMMWDLDSLLFTSHDTSQLVDPVYIENEISENITQEYSRQSQEADFLKQNQMVLHTFTHDHTQLKRFETPIKLLHGFYGNSDFIHSLNFGTDENPLSNEELLTLKSMVDTLPENSAFQSNYVQPGWLGQEDLYEKVFARNCRLCHAQIGNQIIDFDSYDEFISNQQLRPYVYEQGLMPLSRLTMDRFWSDFYGEQSAAEFLRQHLNSDNNTDNDIALDARPGMPVAIVSPEANAETAADVILDMDDQLLLDGTESLFADSYQWRVDGVLHSTDSKFTFTPTAPGERQEIQFLAINSQNFTSSQQESRSVLVRNNIPTVNAFPAQSVLEGGVLETNIYTILCPDNTPDSENCRATFGDIREGETPQLDLVGVPVNGTVDIFDSATGQLRFQSTASETEGNAQFQFTLTDSFDERSEAILVDIAVNSLDAPEIVGPDVCSTPARSFTNADDFPLVFNTIACPSPEINDTVADGLSISLSAVDGSNLRLGSSVNFVSGSIQYTPARFFVGQESFTYSIQDSSLSAKTSMGSVTVNVSPTQTYSSLSTGQGVFASTDGCVDCHVGNLVGAPNWLNPANVRLAATNTNEQPYGLVEIPLSEPTTTAELLASILFKKACDHDGSHQGGNLLCNTTGEPDAITDLNERGLSILRWLEEGARDN